MKASALIKKLREAIDELGLDPDVFFDTEACRFDFHIGEIDRASWDKDIPDMGDKVILYFPNDHYIHSRSEEE